MRASIGGRDIMGLLGGAHRRAARAARKGRFGDAASAWRRAAERGDVEASYRLGLCYLDGKGVMRSFPEAAACFERAAVEGHAEAQFALSGLYRTGDAHLPTEANRWFEAAHRADPDAADARRRLMFPAGIAVARNPERAHRWALAAAEGGKPEAEVQVGLFYAQGFGCRRDYAEARRWYERAAVAGSAQAELGLGAIFARGLGTARDEAAATGWYRTAAARGDATAQYILATRIVEGSTEAAEPGEADALLGRAAHARLPAALHRLAEMQLGADPCAPASLSEAESRLRTAAKQGHLPAMRALATLFGDGRHLPPDPAEAARWHREAAEAGDADAQFTLATLHARGLGVPRIMAEAARWFARAAEAGHAAAAFNLAVFLRDGVGVAADGAKALSWFERAAERGIGGARLKLGLMHARGIGVPHNSRAAAAWLEAAARDGDGEAKAALAMLDLDDDGLPSDIGRSGRLLREAAADGYGPALRDLGLLHLRRARVGIADDGTVPWFAAAAEAGSVEAAIVLAEILLDGHAAAPDPAAAVGWLRRAASAERPGSMDARQLLERVETALAGGDLPAPPPEIPAAVPPVTPPDALPDRTMPFRPSDAVLIPRWQSQTDAAVLRRRRLLGGSATWLAIALAAVMAGLTPVLQVDRIVSSTSGRIVATDPLTTLQTLDPAVIMSVDVEEGQEVRPGQVLATLDPTFADADVVQLRRRLAALDAQVDRIRAEQADAPATPASLTAPGASPFAALQGELFDERAALLRAQMVSLDEQVEATRATIEQFQSDRGHLEEREKIAGRIEDMRQTLYKSGSTSLLKLLQANDSHIELKRTLDDKKSGLVELGHQMAALQSDREAALQFWYSAGSQDLVGAEAQRAATRADLDKALRHQQLVRLTADVPAVVLNITRLSGGSVLKAGDTIATLVPLSAPVAADIHLSAKDTGYVRPGDRADIKIYAFPYLEHGSAKGHIAWISEGTFTTDEDGRSVAPYYKARIAIDRMGFIDVPPSFRLIPGLTLSTDIDAGRRSLFDVAATVVTDTFRGALREP